MFIEMSNQIFFKMNLHNKLYENKRINSNLIYIGSKNNFEYPHILLAWI